MLENQSSFNKRDEAGFQEPAFCLLLSRFVDFKAEVLICHNLTFAYFGQKKKNSSIQFSH
jgi:hypothetical protein